MKQDFLPTMADNERRIVNVASVKHRSPFRYPGGKTWLVPRVYEWLGMEPRPKLFVEPFAGGAIVGLSVAFEELAHRVLLVELDTQVASVWEVIIERGEGSVLADEIEALDLSQLKLDTLLIDKSVEPVKIALRTIVRNRINHGGILASGAGRLKYGENGKGILSRWYPQTLARRIRDIDRIRERIDFVKGDGLKVIEDLSNREDVVFFVDPPYTVSKKNPGSRLYDHSEIDHEHLFELIAAARGDFLMTYDNQQEVTDLAKKYGFDVEAIPMKNTHHAKLTELLIGRNLDWLR